MVPHWWAPQPSSHSLSVGISAPAILSPSCPLGPTCSATAGRKASAFISRVSETVGAFQEDPWFVTAFVINASSQHFNSFIRSTFCMSLSQTVWICAFHQELNNGSCLRCKKAPPVNWQESKQKGMTYPNDHLQQELRYTLNCSVSFCQWGHWPPA